MERAGRGWKAENRGRGGKEEGCPFSWGLWIRQWRRGAKREGQGGELVLGRSDTSFFHFKH